MPRGLLQRFAGDRGGATAILFALGVLPATLAIAGAVDYARLLGARTKVQAALDAGLLDIARQGSLRDPLLQKARLESYVAANTAGRSFTSLSVSAVTSINTLELEAHVDACVPMYFAAVLDKSNGCIRAKSRAQRPKHLEIVMALDNTGSMDTSSKRMDNLRLAARTLVDTMEASVTPERRVKVGLVPFVTAVNVKGVGFKMSWMDQHAANPNHGLSFDTVGGARANHFTLFNTLGIAWKGCVEARPTPFNADDTPPNPFNPGTLFVPYFAPDEPGKRVAPGTETVFGKDGNGRDIKGAYGNQGDYANNSWLDDSWGDATPRVDDDVPRQQGILRSTARYATAVNTAHIKETADHLSGGQNLTNGPNRACPTPILPLTNDFNALRTNVAAMRHWNGSGTNVAEGLGWAWRVLSPEEPYTDGTPFDDLTTQKVVVLLTDGVNEVFGASKTFHKSDYGAYGYLSQNRTGTTDKSTAVSRVNSSVSSMCTQLKERGVKIFTITLEANSTANRTLYGACASEQDNYYPVNNASELTSVFEAIANELKTMRLVN